MKKSSKTNPSSSSVTTDRRCRANRWNEIWLGLATGVTAPSCNRIFVEKRVSAMRESEPLSPTDEEEDDGDDDDDDEENGDDDDDDDTENDANHHTDSGPRSFSNQPLEGDAKKERNERKEEEELKEEDNADDVKEDEDEEEEEDEEETEIAAAAAAETTTRNVATRQDGANSEEDVKHAAAAAPNSPRVNDYVQVAPRTPTALALALARDVGACSIVEAIFKGNLDLRRTLGVLTKPTSPIIAIRVHKSPPSSSSSSSTSTPAPCTLRDDGDKKQFTIYLPIQATDVDDVRARIQDAATFVTEFPAGKGTLKYEFTGRPTEGRVDEAMVALMDEIDCIAALVGQFEMTILTDDKPWNKDVKSEIWVTKTPQIQGCLQRQKEKNDQGKMNKVFGSGINSRGISTRSLNIEENIEEDKISLQVSVKSLSNLAHFTWIQTTVTACTVAEAYFKGFLPLQQYKQGLEFRGLIDRIAENNTLLLLGMDYKMAKQKRPATPAECSVVESRGQRKFDVVLLLPIKKLARVDADFWPKKEGLKMGKVDDLPFDSVFVRSFHQWPKEKYISHYVRDLAQSLYREDKCFQRNKVYVSYTGGHLPWRRARRNGRHEIWVPGCHSNIIRSASDVKHDAANDAASNAHSSNVAATGRPQRSNIVEGKS